MVSQKGWNDNLLLDSRAVHFIFTEDADNLTKPKTKQKWLLHRYF